MNTASNLIYEFGPFRLDADRAVIFRDGCRIPVAPKVFEVLLTLVRHNREVVTKEELLQAVWHGRVVEEANLSQCIFVLRKLLGDSREQHRYIVTAPGRGYRFVTEVRCEQRSDLAAGGTSHRALTVRADAHQPAAPSEREAAALNPRPPNDGLSIAVLPFHTEGDAADRDLFANGLCNGLITALSRFNGLRVIGRNSAFQYRDSAELPAAIARALGVSHLLEGSIQHHGNIIRVTATLIAAIDDGIVLSQRYERPYADIFALQDALARAIADALKAKLQVRGIEEQNDRPPGGNLAAWQAYQRATAYAALESESGARNAIGDYRQAVELDPRYAMAYAGLCEAHIAVWSATGGTSSGTIDDSLSDARAAISTALRLAPDLSCARRAHAHLLLASMDWEGARTEAAHALQLAQSDAEACFSLATTLATLGHNRRALDLTREALTGDPRHAPWYKWLGIYLTALGQLDDARDALHTAINLQPSAADFHAQLAVIEIVRGDSAAALAAARREPSPIWRSIALAVALQLSGDRGAADAALNKLISVHARDAAYQIAEVYALRRDPDAAFAWLARAWAARDGGIGNLLFDPLLLRYRTDQRFALYCNQVGLPATTDALAIA